MAGQSKTDRFSGVVLSKYGRYMAKPSASLYAGSWVQAEDAALAVDRVLLHLGSDRALNLPSRSRKLGPASPAEMKDAARRASKAQGGAASRYFGVYRTGGRCCALGPDLLAPL